MIVKEIPNKHEELQVNKVNMNCDYLLTNKKGQTVPYPLINKSGFLYIINGYSGSGKTTLMIEKT